MSRPVTEKKILTKIKELYEALRETREENERLEGQITHICGRHEAARVSPSEVA